MKQLSFQRKMILSILSFSIPILVLSTLMYKAQTVNINFGKQEALGNRYQKPLERFFQAASFNRIYAARVAQGEQKIGDLLKEVQSQGDNALKEMSAVDKEIGGDLDFTDAGLSKRKRAGATINNLEHLWVEAKRAPEKDENHRQVISMIRTIMAHMGDTSNLILDPDLDSYYLMDISLLALPQTQERIQNIIVHVENLFKSSEVSEADRIQLAVYASMLRDADIGRIETDANTSLNEDPNFFGTSPGLQEKIPVALKKYKADSDKLVSMLQMLAVHGHKNFEPEEFRKASEAALKSSYEFGSVSSAELDTLIDTRVQALSKERSMDMAISLAIWMFSCIFSFQISKSLVSSISSVVKNLSEAGTNVGNSSGRLSSTSQTLSASTSESAASLEESVASIEELTSMVHQTAENSKVVSGHSENAEKETLTGETRIKDLVSKMQQISAESKQVEDIINIIDDIAFQTNLLALNAAVEAARAGDHGKGFAVVADSVRTLASKTADSAKQISSLIQSNVAGIDTGKKLAESCGDSLASLSGLIKKVSVLNKEVAQACEEQSRGLSQISQALNSLDTVTQNNASSSEEIATASENLSSDSATMQTHITYLKEITFGKAS